MKPHQLIAAIREEFFSLLSTTAYNKLAVEAAFERAVGQALMRFVDAKD